MDNLYEKYLNYIKKGFVLAVASNPGANACPEGFAEERDFFSGEGERLSWLKDCTKVKVYPVVLKGKEQFQVTRTVGKKELHENYEAEELAKLLCSVTGAPFKQLELTAESGKLVALVSKKGKITVKEHKASVQGNPGVKSAADGKMAGAGDDLRSQELQPKSHNRRKNYCLPEGTPVPFLVELGVMTRQGLVVAQKYDKFRQINRYLEFVEDIVPSLPKDRELSIIDFGCGKSYLTFALYYYLHEVKNFDVRITGLDLKQDVIDNCNELAKRFGYGKLEFLHGDIATFEGCEECGGQGDAGMPGESSGTDKVQPESVTWNLPQTGRAQPESVTGKRSETGDVQSGRGRRQQVDMVVTLHACDTATDYALEKAIKWGASVIFCVPCCQHELNGQIKCEELQPVLKYGLLKERIAALVTDGLRANLLEEAGYRTQILEFIDMEHTPKNILIRAVRQPLKIKKKTGYERTAELLNAKLTLEKLLKDGSSRH